MIIFDGERTCNPDGQGNIKIYYREKNMGKSKIMIALMLSLAMLMVGYGCGAETFKKGRDIFSTEKILSAPAKEIKVYTPSASENGAALAVGRIFQGVINKQKPQVYIADNVTASGVNVSDVKEMILEQYGEIEFKTCEMDESKAHKDYSVFWSLWRDFSDLIENIYVFDLEDGLQDSLNVAAMLAGRNKGVAVPKKLYEDLFSEGLIGTRRVVDVCEEFGFGHSEGTLGITRWIRDNMVEGSNKELVFMLYPGGRGEDAYSYPAAYDMAVAVDALIYWIDPDFDIYKNLQKEILDQFGSNALVIGWPGINMEGAYVNSVSACGKNVVCADWGFANGSLYAAFEDYYPEECTTVPAEETVLNNKVYVAFTVSDGDAWHYATKELLAYWNNPVRGSVPITWTIPSLFARFHPTLLRYLYDTKSPLDEFIQGPSGVGYVYPTQMPQEAFSDYCEKTRSALEKLKINMVNYWDSSDSYYTPDNARLIEYCQTVQPEAVFLGHSSADNSYFMIGDTVCIHEMGYAGIRGTQTAGEIVEDIERAVSRAEGNEPVFIAVNVEAWGQGVSTIAAAYTELLEKPDGGRYEFVTSAALIGKIRQYEENGADGTFDSEGAQVRSISFQPGGEGEGEYLFKDSGSGVNPDKGNRFADSKASWTYRFKFDTPLSLLILKMDLGEEFLVRVSVDGVNWETALVYGGVRQGEKTYLTDVLKLTGGKIDTLYVQFEDAVKETGFGCSLTSFKLYYC